MKYLLLLSNFLVFSCSLWGSVIYTPQNSNPLFESWRWKPFTELDDKAVRCFTEGNDNSLWFGTAKGVYAYDGLNWTNYHDENEVLQAPVYGICYTQSDVLYVVSTKGICHLSRGVWTTDLLFPKSGVLGNEWEILNIVETSGGQIWVGLYFGLIRINNKKITLYTTANQIKEIRSSFNEIKIEDVTGVYPGIEAFIIFDILEDRSGNLWLAHEDGRTIRYYNKNKDLKSPGNFTIYTGADGLALSRLTLLFESSKNIIYNISQSVGGAVNTFNPETEKWSSLALSDDFGGDNINFSITETPDGTIWIGGFSRIFVNKDNNWLEFKQPLIQVPPTRIILKYSSDGSLWMIGHQADVIRIEYQSSRWNTYKDLLYQCQTDDGKQWFINGEGNVVSFDSSSYSWEMLEEEFPLSDPTRLFIDKSKTLWAVGSLDGSAALAWYENGIWEYKSFPELCWGFHSNGIFQSKDNSIWFGANADCGTTAWGIIRYNPSVGARSVEKAWKHYKGTEVCEVAYALGETKDGNLLCGYFKGLFEFSGTQVRELHQVLLNDVIKVESIVQDPIEGVWIGTRSQGVIHYITDEQWTQYTMENGLASNSVTSLIFSDDSTLWVATDKGISRFDGEKWTRLALPEYFKISRGNGSLEKGSNNSIWINSSSIEWYRRVFYKKEYNSTNSPLVSYRIQPENIAPETEIIVFDKKVYYPGNAMIVWKGLDRWNDTKPSELQYSYRLDDEEWSDFSSETSHNFLALKRGYHTVEVRSRDNFLNADMTPAKVRFKVIPPVWGQVWFLLLIISFVAAIIYLLTSSLKKNREMEAQNKIMQQKNDNLVRQQAEIEEKSKQIMELLEKERENHWFNEGVIAINEVIKSNKDNLYNLSHSLTVKFIEYLEIHSAGIMLYQNGDEENGGGYLELLSAYGYNQERLANKKIMPEEGLVGACFKEKKTMIFRNVPSNYLIESGMGKARAAELVLVPLKLHDDIVGIIEISSFQAIDDKKIRLLEIIAENVASNIISLGAKARIEELYKQSQENAARLHEQEEELHQQMEELQATQEESQRREQKLLAELDLCKKKKEKKGKD